MYLYAVNTRPTMTKLNLPSIESPSLLEQPCVPGQSQWQKMTCRPMLVAEGNEPTLVTCNPEAGLPSSLAFISTAPGHDVNIMIGPTNIS